MNARPLLFSAPMVRALLAGTKTQTRRTIKPQPECGFIIGGRGSPACPYGALGDLLWVRETWRAHEYPSDGNNYDYRECAEWRGDASKYKWRPSIYMPRSASRITLRITEVRVERLKEISEADASAEGIEREGKGWKSYEIIHEGRYRGERHPHAVVPNRSPITSYKELWESINGHDSWAGNPWVWCLSFDVIQRNITEVMKDG